jgi:hypothetical protein
MLTHSGFRSRLVLRDSTPLSSIHSSSTPTIMYSSQSEDSLFGGSLMQVDDPTGHYQNRFRANLCMPPSPTPQPKRPKLSNREQIINLACDTLGRLVHHDDKESHILSRMKSIWGAVNGALYDMKASGSLAEYDEFRANVKDKGDKEFVEVLRDLAEKNCWSDLFQNCMFLFSFDLECSHVS